MASQINRVLWTNLVDDYYAVNILTLLADGTVDMHLYNRDSPPDFLVKAPITLSNALKPVLNKASGLSKFSSNSWYIHT